MTTVQTTNTAPAEELTYCEVHPDRETALRCNKCGRLMCVECAVQTPVGYRCRQCVRQHEDKFYKASSGDDVKVFSVCFGLMVVAGAIFSAIPLGLFLALIAGVPAGGAVSEVALRVVQRRRGRRSGEIGAAGAVMGGVAGAMLQTYLQYNSMMSQVAERAGVRAGEIPGISIDALFQGAILNIGLLLFIGIIAAAVYGRFKMKI
ncbi:MAG: B-box zinc finger protein [Anaerolineae bacterium]|nr:B-box zinc finger protein [Anaerolineae bacterium]